MQKKLIALAIAGLSSAAFAQSNVTIYGVMDLGQAWVKSSDVNGTKGQSSVGRLDSNSSYIGFKGAESLGNGLTAVFQYETNFTADTAGALAGGRDTYIGLAGGFGTVAAGNLTHPLRAFGSKVELLPGAAGFGSMSSITGQIGGGHTGADDRAANALAYISPNMSGFTFIAAYVNGEAKPNDTAQALATANSTIGTAAPAAGFAWCGNTLIQGTAGTTVCTPASTGGNANAYQVAGQYENGPLFVGLAYHRANDIGGVKDTDARVWRLAGVYNFPSNTKLTALYDNTKVDAGGALSAKRNAWSLGVAQGFGATTVGLEFARSGNISNAAGNLDNTGSRIVSLVGTYDLSKRTSLHARYSKLSNDDNIGTGFYNNPVANPTALPTGSDSTGYMVGLRHTF